MWTVACRGLVMPWVTAWLYSPYQILVLCSGVWSSLLLDMRCLWRHNMTSNSGLQTNVLAKSIDITCIIFYISGFQLFGSWNIFSEKYQMDCLAVLTRDWLCWHVMDNEPQLCCTRWSYIIYFTAKVPNFQEHFIKDLWISPWTTKNSRGTTGSPSGKTKRMWTVAPTGQDLSCSMISWLALMHKWNEKLRKEKNGGGMSWETCHKADYLDDVGGGFDKAGMSTKTPERSAVLCGWMHQG